MKSSLLIGLVGVGTTTFFGCARDATIRTPANASATTQAANEAAAIEVERAAIESNLQNARTHGYKRLHVEMRDGKPVTQVDVTMGPFQNTGRQVDVAIQGQGFFQVQTEDGIAYTRSGNFFIANDHTIVFGSSSLATLMPTLKLPPETTDVTITEDGSVQVRVSGSPDAVLLGRLTLARFPNAQALMPITPTLFRETAASGAPSLAFPITEGLEYDVIMQGFLEASNVDVAKEQRRLDELDAMQCRQNCGVASQNGSTHGCCCCCRLRRSSISFK